MVFLYDKDAGFLRTALTFRHTVIPIVLTRAGFWLFMCFHIAVAAAYRYGYIKSAEEDEISALVHLDWNDMKVVSAIATFCLVFYLNQCYRKYVDLHDLVTTMHSNCLIMASEAWLHFGRDSPEGVWLACRYHLAALYYFYHSMESVQERDWCSHLAQRLLRAEELNILQNYPRDFWSFLLLHWSGVVLKRTHTKTKAPANVLKSMVDKVLFALRTKRQISDSVALLVPFQYFHILTFMLSMNLLLWAFLLGTTNALWGSVVFACCAFMFVGMFELGNELINPFGNGEVDLPVDLWLRRCYDATVILFNSHYPFEDIEFTEVIKDERAPQPLPAWGDESDAQSSNDVWETKKSCLKLSGFNDQRLLSSGDSDADDDD